MSRYIEKSMKEGIITPQQADKIYEIMDKEKSIKPLSFLAIFFTAVAVFLATVIIYLTVFENTILSHGAKIGILICLTFISAFAGYHLKFSSKYGKTGAAFLFFSVLFFGALIFVTAKTYALNPGKEFHFLVLLWMIAVFPYMYIFKSKAVAALISLLLILWFTLFVTFGENWIIVTRPLLPFAYLSLGVFLLCFGKINEFGGNFSGIAKIFQKISLIIISIAAFLLTFSYFANAQGRATFDVIFILGIQIKLSSLLFALLGLMFLFSLFTNAVKASNAIENILTAVLIIYCVFLSVNENIPSIMADALFVLTTGALIASGYRRRDTFYANLGILWFLLFIVSKYFIFSRGALPFPLYYSIGAILIIVIVLAFENRRRSFKRYLLNINVETKEEIKLETKLETKLEAKKGIKKETKS